MTNDSATKTTVAAQYDTDAERWLQIRQSGHELLEKPALYSLLPDLTGKRVLSLGCGFGEECHEMLTRGAREVIGIDISDGNLEKARCAFPHIKFLRMDMEDLSFPDTSFDIVVSSLSIHYLSDWGPTLRNAKRVLSADGSLIISTHHPATWSAIKDENASIKRQLLGFELNKQTNDLAIYGDYLTERRITAKFGGSFEATFYHKTFSSMLREFRESKFQVLDCLEPAPVPGAAEHDPTFFQIRSRLPIFILFRLSPV